MAWKSIPLLFAAVLLGCPPGANRPEQPVASLCGPPSGSAPAEAPHGGLQGAIRTEDGEPVSGARVLVEGTSCAAISDDDGFYSIEGLPAGTHTLVVQLIGYDTLRRPGIKVSEGATADVDLILGATGILIQKHRNR